MREGSVVLPAPLGPTGATIWPGSATNETPRRIGSDGSVDRPSAGPPLASSEAIDTSDGAGYRNQTSSTSMRPLTRPAASRGAALGLSAVARGASRTPKTRANDTRAGRRSTRAEARAVRGEYRRAPEGAGAAEGA